MRGNPQATVEHTYMQEVTASGGVGRVENPAMQTSCPRVLSMDRKRALMQMSLRQNCDNCSPPPDLPSIGSRGRRFNTRFRCKVVFGVTTARLKHARLGFETLRLYPMAQIDVLSSRPRCCEEGQISLVLT